MKNLFLMFFLFGAFNVFAGKGTQVESLSCNFLTNPLGIEASPKLSWKIVSAEKGQQQTAYEIRVAGSIQSLNSNSPDMWNTGKVLSDQSVLVEYKGIPLKSAQRVYWKVRIWDKNGKASAWSEAAWWEKGLDKSNWKGKWIAARENLPKENPQLDSAYWIWLKKDAADQPSELSSAWFYKELQIDKAKTIESAKFIFSALGKYSVWINSTRSDYGSADSVKVIDATQILKSGNNYVKIFSELSGENKGIIGEIKIRYEDGTTESFSTDSTWKASEKEPSGVNNRNLKEVIITGVFDKRPIQWAPKLPHEVDAAPYFRKTFAVPDKKIKTARVYIGGLGYYELYLNGSKVGDHVLDPVFTRYDKRVLYVSYDITDKILAEKNVIGVILGNGFFNQHARDVWYFHKAPWRATPRVLLQMNIVYEDGSEQQLFSDSTWKVTTGPIVFDGIRNGEYYDANKEKPEWNLAITDDNSWPSAVEVSAPKGELCAQELPPIRVTQTLPFKNVTQPATGIMVYDIGQNIAGWVRIKVSGAKGTTLRLKYGEKLDSTGRVDQSNINWYLFQGNMQEDCYTLKGEGIETWEPRFVYHGFQYVEISGFGSSKILEVDGRVIHTDFKKTGDFTCSDTLLNKIHRNACWSYRGNFIGIPIDCPQREKNGWLADAHLGMETGLMNFDNTAAYYSWLRDLRDEQASSGQLPGIVPTSGWGYDHSGGPSWETAFLLIPWYIYQYKGDTDILKVNYPGWKKQMKYLADNSENYLLNFGLNDWLAVETTPAVITSTGTYYYNAVIMSKAAHLLGYNEDEITYATLADSIKSSFLKHFFDRKTGKIGPGTQMAQLVPLYYHWVDTTNAKMILQYLVNDIQKHNNHFTIGAIGSKMILRTLCDYGYDELAYTLATQTTFPSWGNWINKGATTLWENWNGQESLNHIFMGDIDAWFYSYLAGIRTDEATPGFKHFVIKPFVPLNLYYASANVSSPYGLIHSSWQKKGSLLVIDITVPVNTSASFYIPEGYKGQIAKEAKKPTISVNETDRVILLSSGRYKFEIREK